MTVAVIASLATCGCERLSNDYDHDVARAFWAAHPSLNDPTTERDAEQLKIASQYAVYRYGMEHYEPPRMEDVWLVKNRFKAVPYIHSKLDSLPDGYALWTVLIVLKNIDGYDRSVRRDPRLVSDLARTAKRTKDIYRQENLKIIAAIRDEQE